MNGPATIGGMRGFTRRDFWALAGVAGVLRGIGLRAEESCSLKWDGAAIRGPATERHYRADAQVLILSIPILKRSGVGEGRSAWRESDAGPGCRRRLLEFSAFSTPARAAGLNRFGFMQEMSSLEGGGGESIYFGLMSASTEESAEEARKALGTKQGDAVYAAIEGSLARGRAESAGARFTAPARLSATEREELVARARVALAAAPRKPAEFAVPPEGCRPFLHALAGLLRAPETGDTRFIYSGRLYRMWVRRAPDPKATRQFGRKVVRVSGKLRREPAGKETEFKLWVEEGASRPLPLRIEYQAKSYLRLIFEAV